MLNIFLTMYSIIENMLSKYLFEKNTRKNKKYSTLLLLPLCINLH